MNYYSTKNRNRLMPLKEAVIRGLAEDAGLFMPERLPVLPASYLEHIYKHTFPEISLEVARQLFGKDVPPEELEQIVTGAISFDTPLVELGEGIYTLELFHGPTLAFKDVGARFMARLLGYFVRDLDRLVHVLVATSGDTGSAVASGFYQVPGIHVHILYPSGLVSKVQEKQFTTLGHNITALEVGGSFDDCQRLVKTAFNDPQLRNRLFLTSANSINLARLLPQTFYYFNILARLPEAYRHREEDDGGLVISVPSGNFGNLTAGMMAHKMGLPVKRFIAATNINDVVPEYLDTGRLRPRPSIPTLANAMDVGNPSNFVRILDMYGHSLPELSNMLTSEVSTDEDMRITISEVWKSHGYLLEPHGATGYRSLIRNMEPGETGVFLETAHPSKFSETVEQVTGTSVDIPERLSRHLSEPSRSIPLSTNFKEFKQYLLSRDD
jgi:threonine synthase